MKAYEYICLNGQLPCDKDFYHGRGKSISLPAKDGAITILAHHADMMVAIVPGEMRFQAEDNTWYTAIVGGGFAQIINNRVTVLADSIEKPEDIDLKRLAMPKNVQRNSSVRSRVCRNTMFPRLLWPELWLV